MSESLYNDFIIDFVYNSEVIEGTPITIQDVRSICLDGESISLKASGWISHIKQHYYLANEVLQKPKYLHIADILYWHECLFKNMLNDAGSLRRHKAYIGGSGVVLAEPEFIYRLLCDFFTKYNDYMYNIDSFSKYYHYCAVARRHHAFERIHPFSDGNGRMGRLILLHDLERLNLDLKIIQYKTVNYYYKALEEGEDVFADWFAEEFESKYKKGINRTHEER